MNIPVILTEANTFEPYLQRVMDNYSFDEPVPSKNSIILDDFNW